MPVIEEPIDQVEDGQEPRNELGDLEQNNELGNLENNFGSPENDLLGGTDVINPMEAAQYYLGSF